MNRLLKPLGLLAVVILFCTVVSRIFTGSETLSDYARKNPEIAYATPAATTEAASSMSPLLTAIPPTAAAETATGTGKNADSVTSPIPEANTNSAISPTTGSGANGGSATSPTAEANVGSATNPTANPASGGNMTGASFSSPAPIPPGREIYQPDFYKEPLSESLIADITGISYPVPEEEAGTLMEQKTTGQTDVPVLNMVANKEDIAISYDQLRYLSILYYDFSGQVQTGELICNEAIADDLLEIFYELYLSEYQIEKMRLIDEYGGDDTLSMLDNNTSCFNYRTAADSGNLSKHALGLAIDINPFYNPYVYYRQDGSVYISPEGSEIYADRTQSFPYKIDDTDLCYKLFLAHGFIWGGNWNYQKDYQHFQKSLP